MEKGPLAHFLEKPFTVISVGEKRKKKKNNNTKKLLD